MKYIIISLLLIIATEAKYLDNHSCSECHENIYEEFQSSMHSKGYFNNELHRKIADSVSTKKYDCAVCHTPAADNLADLISGKARPDKHNKTHTDAISCYFCHTIAYVKKSHKFNINIKAKQAQNYKPTLYGRLQNPESSDKHSSVNNPIYGQKVCLGCHSHKLNDNNATVFRAMQKDQNSQECIKCHMPEIAGGAEKLDKRARGHHASHKFLGIHDIEFRKTGIDIDASATKNNLEIKLHNKMAHPLIIQPARAKYLLIKLTRDGKTIWQNYKNDPREDKQGYFSYSFKKNAHKIIIPAQADSSSQNNIAQKSTKVLHYTIPTIKSSDKITISLWVQLAKSDCTKVVSLEDKNLTKPSMIKEITLIIK